MRDGPSVRWGLQLAGCYVLVNSMLVIIWAVTDIHGFFWPAFPIAGWGIGVVMNAWDVYWRPQITEEDIQREIQHRDRRS